MNAVENAPRSTAKLEREPLRAVLGPSSSTPQEPPAKPMTGKTVTIIFNGPIQNVHLSQTAGTASMTAGDWTEDCNALNTLLNVVIASASGCTEKTKEEIERHVATIREQMERAHPKRDTLQHAIDSLKAIDAGARFADTIVQVINHLLSCGAL